MSTDIGQFPCLEAIILDNSNVLCCQNEYKSMVNCTLVYFHFDCTSADMQLIQTGL